MIKNLQQLILNKPKVLYADRFEFFYSTTKDFSCKICGKPLAIIKRRKKDYYAIKSCICQLKKGNRKYLETVFGEGTEESKKYWEEYKKKTYKKGPLLDKLIKKYGLTDGKKRYTLFLKKCNVSLKGFIERNGKEKGLEKYEQFKKKSLVTKEAMILRHGEEEGLLKYNKMVNRMKKVSKFTLNYWLNFFDGDYTFATEAYKKYQSKDLFFFISKYGPDEGSERYEKLRKKRKEQNTLEHRILSHGKKEGTIKWENECEKKRKSAQKEYYIEKYGEKKGLYKFNIICKSKSHSLSNYIHKFGEDEGLKKYIAYKKLLILNLSQVGNKSVFQLDFIEELIKYGKFKKTDLLYDGKELMIFNEENGSLFFYDVCYPETKTIIEIQGDFWHANPAIYKSNYFHSVQKKSAKEIWKKDALKKDLAEKCGYRVLYLWEKDIRFNRYPEITKGFNFLRSTNVADKR